MQYLTNLTSRVNGGLFDFPRSVDDLFHRFWGGSASVPVPAAAFRPAVDVVETTDAYLLHVEIPGIEPEAVDVTLAGDTLTIRGAKPQDAQQDERTWRLRERIAGEFVRTFKLPLPVATDSIEASARNGVLTVRVAKAKEAMPQKIQVRSA